MNILNRIKCSIVGHDVTGSESLVKNKMLDNDNWLRQCRRCGMYVMHSEHMAVCMSEREALEVKRDLEELYREFGIAEPAASETKEQSCE